MFLLDATDVTEGAVLLTDEGPAGLDLLLDWVELPVAMNAAAACMLRFDDADTASGDWCDVLPLGGTRLGIVVGDAMGRGRDAAPLAAELSRAARLLLSSGHAPAEVLARLDSIVRPLGDVIATVSCAVLDRGVGVLELANAGHPPPLVAPERGDAYYLYGRPQAPLGTGLINATDVTRWAVPRGTLLFYTDGLVERRARPLGDDMDRFLDWARLHADGHARNGLASVCAEAVRANCCRPPEDDVTVLALAVSGGAA